MRSLDTGDGIDDNGGVPRTLLRNYLYTTWTWPANAPDPLAFEVIFFTGTDPAVTNNYLVPIQKALPSDRGLQIALPIKTTITNVNTAVRAIYE